MKYDVKTVLYCVKEIMKLPLDKKTNLIKMDDVKKLIEKLIKPLPEKEAWECLETLEIMADKQIMKRFKQKSKGKNIPLKEMIKRLKKK